MQGPGDWLWRYYTYRVTVYCPWTQCIEVSYSNMIHLCQACASVSSTLHSSPLEQDSKILMMRYICHGSHMTPCIARVTLLAGVNSVWQLPASNIVHMLRCAR